jgi:hypothetical protein
MTAAMMASSSRRDSHRHDDQPGIDRVREFYRQNHAQQTCACVQAQKQKAKRLRFDQRETTPWQALDCLIRIRVRSHESPVRAEPVEALRQARGERCFPCD